MILCDEKLVKKKKKRLQEIADILNINVRCLQELDFKNDDKNHIYAFETSSPGLRGQSGGPIFGPDGLVYGMQYMTKHLDLNFDVNKVVKRGIKDKQINYTPFINLGAGITSVEIINFLEKNKVKYYSN